MAIEELLDCISEENKRLARTTLRDPLSYELDLPEFNAVWNVIKNWDIGRPTAIMKNGGQLYSHGTGTDVATILDALRGAGIIAPLKQPVLEGSE